VTGRVPRSLPLLAVLALAVAAAGDTPPPLEGCTIGVAAGRATADGRPLLWKARDAPASPDNEVVFNDAFPYRFVAVVNADGTPDSPAWMGVNEHGFAILNSNVGALAAELPGNGELMRDALGTCRSVHEFVALLDSTSGQRQTHGNFGVIDTTGAACLLEIAADAHWTYDADAAPAGFLVRANFACVDTAGQDFWSLPGAHRFVRAGDVVGELAAAGTLDARRLLATHMRDFSDWACEPYPIPCADCGTPDSLYGGVDTFWSICSKWTVSAAVIHGVAPGEPGFLSTLWAQLGQPATTVAAPYWPVGATPTAADGDTTAPLCDRARQIRASVFRYPYYPRVVDTFRLRDGDDGGFWAVFLPFEAAAIAAVEDRLAGWRAAPPAWSVVQALEDSLVGAAFDLIASYTAVVPEVPATARAIDLAAPHPNPFNPAVTLDFTLARAGRVEIAVYDLRGRQVARLADGEHSAGAHSLRWDAAGLPSGTYLVRSRAHGTVATRRCLLVK